MVREVKEALKKQQEGSTQCKISQFLFKQHTTPNSVTGKSPAEMLTGRRLRTALDRLHLDRQHAPAVHHPETKRYCVGDAVYSKSFTPGPRWKAARVVAVRGPVSYTVQLDNGERHHRHRNQLRSAWTRSESGTGVGCHAGFFPTARRPQPQSTTPEATQEESPSPPPEESSATRPQQQMTSPEAPEASPEQANQDSTAPRRSTRVRRPVLRYGIND